MKRLYLRGLTMSCAVAMLLCARAYGQPETSAGKIKLSPPPEAAAIVPRFLRRMSAEHLERRTFDDSLSPQAWTNFLSTLDPERIYFSSEDIAGLAIHRDRLATELAAENVDFAFDAYNLFTAVVAERYTYVTNLLNGEFDLSIDEEYTWQRDEAAWPATGEEQNELWRKRIKNEYLRRIVADEFAEELAEEKEPATTNDNEYTEALLNPVLAPRENIERRYERYMSVMKDNDAEWVLREYLSAVARTFDPHSSYLSRSAMEDFDIEMKLSLVGIGALLRSDEGAAQVVRLIPGGPAERDKRERRLRPGDRIIAVAQDEEPPVDILHWPLYRVVRLIRGEKGTRVVLTVIPASDPTGSTVKYVDIIRDEVQLEEQAAKAEIKTVTDSRGNECKLGIVKLPAFYANLKAKESDSDYRSATDDVEEAIRGLVADGAKGIMLDLRGNGGGSLVEAIKLTGLFIRTGPVVQVKERFRIRILPDRDPKVAYDGPLVVMVNRLSASASEIVAGALQDYGRAVVIGDSQTHGKGTVQSIIDLGNDPALGSIKVTSAKFYRVNGSSTQKRGISSDIIISSPYEFMDLGEDKLPNAMEWTAVGRAAFMPWGNLQTIVPLLKGMSKERRDKSERWQAYQQLLKRIEDMQNTRSVPLNIDQRRAMAQTEKDLNELQTKLIDGENEDNNGSDIVRDEGLIILADLVKLMQMPMEPPLRRPQNDQRSFSDVIGDWIRYNL